MTQEYSRCTDRLFATYIIGSVIMNMKNSWSKLHFQNYDWIKSPCPACLLFSPPSCSSGGTQPPFLNHQIYSLYNISKTLQYIFCETWLPLSSCSLFKIKTTGSKRSLEKICLYSSGNNETWPLNSSLQNPSAYHQVNFKKTRCAFSSLLHQHIVRAPARSMGDNL